MKKFLFIVLCFIVPIKASYRPIDDEIIELAKNVRSEKISLEERENLIDKYFSLRIINQNKVEILSLVNNIAWFPNYNDQNINFPKFTTSKILTNIINNLRDTNHPSFQFSLEDKKDILNSISKNILKLMPKLQYEETDSSKNWIIANQNTSVLKLCNYLLSDEGEAQLIIK